MSRLRIPITYTRALVGGALLLSAGCARLHPAQVGHMAGAVAGSVLLPGIGGPLGAIVGMLAGNMIQKKVDDENEVKERTELSKRLQRPEIDPGIATQDDPEGLLTRVWVDESIEDGDVIAGHFEERVVP